MCDMSLSDYVKAEVYDEKGNKAALSVNPVGQFNPGGCIAFISMKKDQVLPLKSGAEIYEFLLKKIYFENLEVAFDLDNYTLANVLEYTKGLEVNEENDWYLNYFKRLEQKTEEFKTALLAMETPAKIIARQYHEASGELCDFVDYLCVPEGEDEETLREFFEENLTADSEIDEIMEQFEDGSFYGNGFEAEERITADLKNQTFEKTMTVTNVR